MTYFEVGDIVRPNVTAQGMTKGQDCRVVNVRTTHMPFGTYVDYLLDRPDGVRIDVRNLHVLASLVDRSAP